MKLDLINRVVSLATQKTKKERFQGSRPAGLQNKLKAWAKRGLRIL